MGTCRHCNIRHPDFYCPVESRLKKIGRELLDIIEERIAKRGIYVGDGLDNVIPQIEKLLEQARTKV